MNGNCLLDMQKEWKKHFKPIFPPPHFVTQLMVI